MLFHARLSPACSRPAHPLDGKASPEDMTGVPMVKLRTNARVHSATASPGRRGRQPGEPGLLIAGGRDPHFSAGLPWPHAPEMMALQPCPLTRYVCTWQYVGLRPNGAADRLPRPPCKPVLGWCSDQADEAVPTVEPWLEAWLVGRNRMVGDSPGSAKPSPSHLGLGSPPQAPLQAVWNGMDPGNMNADVERGCCAQREPRVARPGRQGRGRGRGMTNQQARDSWRQWRCRWAKTRTLISVERTNGHRRGRHCCIAMQRRYATMRR